MSLSKSAKASKRTHKIIFLGDSGVGKTCVIEKFATNRFDELFNVYLSLVKPTIGIDFVSKDIKFKGSICRLQLWDTAGQEKFKSLVPTYLRDAVCCIFVFDLSSKKRLTQSPKPFATWRTGSRYFATIRRNEPFRSSAGTRTIWKSS
jgi:Ras-related protein Rab-6A